MTVDEAEGHLLRCDSYGRLPHLLGLEPIMERTDWLSLLGRWWDLCDNVGQLYESGELLECAAFWDVEGPIMAMMDAEEQTAFSQLPDTLTIYRGCYAHNKWGMSWSLSRDVAERFPFLSRYRHEGQRPLLVKARIQKNRIIALKNGRDEQEVICFNRPTHIATYTARPQPIAMP